MTYGRALAVMFLLVIRPLASAAPQAGPEPSTRDPKPETRNLPLYDPALDPATGLFSYLAKPSNLLAIVGQRGATQLTWDGAFYTGAAELCLVTGDPPQPVLARLKQLGYGHLPIVHTAWQSGEVRYSVSAFAALVEAGGEMMPVDFIRLQVRRMAPPQKGAAPTPGLIGCAIRRSGGDHRAPLVDGPLVPGATYEFGEKWAAVDGAAVYLLPSTPPAKRYAVVGEPYQQPFTAEQHAVKPETATLIALWDLGSADEIKVDLKLPWTPIPVAAEGKLAAVRAADFDKFAGELAQEWTDKLAQGTDLSFPEAKPLDAYAVNVVYTLMAVERKTGEPTRLVPRLRKEPLRPEESSAIIRALEVAGHQVLAREALMGLLDRQQRDGCLSPQGDRRGQAEIMLAAVRHHVFTHDRDWGASVYPRLQKAMGWLAEASLMGSAPPNVGEQIAISAAMASAADMAADLGHADEAAKWRSHLAALPLLPTGGAAAIPSDGLGPLLVAAGLPSLAAKLPPAGLADAQITDLLRRLHGSYAEGVLAEDGVLSPLRTMEVARLHAARGEQEQALRDLYNILVHTDACHGGFATGARAWGDRDSGEDYPPDLVFAAAYVALVREFLVREQGDDLHLFSVIAPGWLKGDKPTGFKNALTAFGAVTAAATLSDKGAEVDIWGDWKRKPGRIILHVPWFVEVTQVSADEPGLVRKEGPPSTAYETRDLPAAAGGAPNRWIELDPNTTHVALQWRRKETPALSYEDALTAWRERYRKVYAEHLAAGGEHLTLAPMPLR